MPFCSLAIWLEWPPLAPGVQSGGRRQGGARCGQGARSPGGKRRQNVGCPPRCQGGARRSPGGVQEARDQEAAGRVSSNQGTN